MDALRSVFTKRVSCPGPACRITCATTQAIRAHGLYSIVAYVTFLESIDAHQCFNPYQASDPHSGWCRPHITTTEKIVECEGIIMYYSETAIAALHRSRSLRLRAIAEGRTKKSRGQGVRSFLARPRKAPTLARTAQPVHSG